MTVFKKLLTVFAVALLSVGVMGATSTAVLAQADDDSSLLYETTSDSTWGDDYENWLDTAEDSYTVTFDDLTASEQAAVTGGIFAVFGVMLLPLLCVGLVVYIYVSVALMVTAKKVGVENGWLAFVPIANWYLMNKVAGLDDWMFLLMFVPGVNFVYMIYAWMKVAERRGFENWMGLLILVPLVGFFIPGYIAWGTPSTKVAAKA